MLKESAGDKGFFLKVFRGDSRRIELLFQLFR
jgi:hypothetical protein